MTVYRNAKIRKQIDLLERRRDHLLERNKGSWDVSEAAALGVAVEAIKEKYPERPEQIAISHKPCNLDKGHGMHFWTSNNLTYSCGGYSNKGE